MKEIFTRRSIRKYVDKPVEEDKIDRLLRAAMQAPSSLNQQVWEFIVVRDRETLLKMSDASHPEKYSKSVGKAPLGIVTLANLGKLKDPESWMKDMGACMENILLEAVYLGLGAVWLGMDTEDAKRHIRGIFNLPDTIEPFAVTSIGYPAEGRENKFLDHYDATKVHWDGYHSGN